MDGASGTESNQPRDNNTLNTTTMSPDNNTPNTVTLSPDDNKPDTVAAAKQEQKDQGPCVDEINFGKEKDQLREKYKSCDKNPSHEKFIPIYKFDGNHLSIDYRDEDIVEAIKTLSNLTVHVSVHKLSDNRPIKFPGSDKPYPPYDDRKKGNLGTGLVCKMLPSKNDLTAPNNDFCKCNICKISPQPKIRFAKLFISTAGHVVFDKLEGKYTSCFLFFDNGDSPTTQSDVVQLCGKFHVSSNIDTDLCQMTYFTHDEGLIKRLEKNLMKLRGHESNIKVNYDLRFLTELKTPSLENQLSGEILVVIVSHPHGCSKQVSIGDCVHLDNDKSIITYTTATCPGSSGAPVFFTGKLGKDRPTHLTGDKKCNYGRFSGDKAS